MNEKTSLAIHTFEQRARKYNAESTWVSDIELVKPLIPEPFGSKRLLEICSGTGIVANYAHAVGWNVTATDISQDMLQENKNSEIALFVGDSNNLKFANNSFDIVVCRQGLQYLELTPLFKQIEVISKSQIRFGHITLEHPEDYSWWDTYFKIASPGRRHIFHPFQLPISCEDAGLIVQSVQIVRTRSSFYGPINHLEPTKLEIVKSHYANSSSEFKSRYNFLASSDGDLQYSHRWEFVSCCIK